MKKFLIITLLLALAFIATASFFEEDRCSKAVDGARKHFSKLDKEKKREFVVKVAKKLKEKFPNVDSKKIYGFLKVLFFSEKEAKHVCALFKRIFKPEDLESEIMENVEAELEETDSNKCKICKAACKLIKNPLKKKACEFACKKTVCKKLFAEEDFELEETEFDKCKVCKAACKLIKDPLKKKACEFACDKTVCKKALLSEPEFNFLKCLENCLKGRYPKERIIEAIFQCKLDMDCYLKMLGEDAKGCLIECLLSKDAEPAMEEFAEPEEDAKCTMCKKACDYINDDERKQKCHDFCDEYVCKNYGGNFVSSETIPSDVPSDEEEDKCAEKVKKVRTYFYKLKTREEKKEFLQKVGEKFLEKHPNAPKAKVFKFMGLVFFTPTPSKYVCEVYKKWFENQSPEVEEHFDKCKVCKAACKLIKDPLKKKACEFACDKTVCKKDQLFAEGESKFLKCLENCLKGRYPKERIIEAIFQCKLDVKCYTKMLGEDAKGCLIECL